MLPLYLMLLLLTCTAFATYPLNVKFYLLWVVVLYTMIIPVLALGILRSMNLISDYKIDIRRERIIPLLIGAICYMLCAITIAKIPSVAFMRKFMVAAACSELFCLAVSLKWKISLHLTGMGVLTGLIVLLNFVGVTTMFIPLICVIVAAGLLASARLYLGCHTPTQILVGFSSGFIIATIAVLLA